MTTPKPRHARNEATALLPTGHEARVLEPSPPVNTDPDWFADDPTDPEGALGTIVTPIPGEGTTWTELAVDHPDVTDYAADHWLGAYRRLEELPTGYDAGRCSLHQLAFFAVSPKRFAETTKLALRYTHGGFGTPFFGDGEQVRVEDDLLVYQQGDQVRSTQITTLEAACRFLGIPYQEVWFADFHDPLSSVGAATELSRRSGGHRRGRRLVGVRNLGTRGSPPHPGRRRCQPGAVVGGALRLCLRDGISR